MADMTAAAAPVTINGNSWRLAPLRDVDIEELNNWIRASIIRLAQSSLTPEMTHDDRDEVLTIAMREARRVSLFTSAGREYIKDPTGISRVLLQCLRKHQPALTLEEVRTAVMADPAGVKEAMTMFLLLNNDGEVKTQSGSPKARKRRKSSSPSDESDT